MLNWICILRSRDAENSLNINEMIILSLTVGAYLTATSAAQTRVWIIREGEKLTFFFFKVKGSVHLNYKYKVFLISPQVTVVDVKQCFPNILCWAPLWYIRTFL